nr:MAG: hypothetical protein [Molluscum contagiosum virus]
METYASPSLCVFLRCTHMCSVPSSTGSTKAWKTLRVGMDSTAVSHSSLMAVVVLASTTPSASVGQRTWCRKPCLIKLATLGGRSMRSVFSSRYMLARTRTFF